MNKSVWFIFSKGREEKRKEWKRKEKKGKERSNFNFLFGLIFSFLPNSSRFGRKENLEFY